MYSATKASFEALISSGDVDSTQIGIIAETGELWANGAYYPIVNASLFGIKTYVVEFTIDDLYEGISVHVREDELRNAIAEGRLILVPTGFDGGFLPASVRADDFVYLTVTSPYGGDVFEVYVTNNTLEYELKRTIPREGHVIERSGVSDHKIAVADGFYCERDGMVFALPNSSAEGDGAYDYTLATQEYVRECIPTAVATAKLRLKLTTHPTNGAYKANVVYEWIVSVDRLPIQSLYANDNKDDYDNEWVIRFGCHAGTVLSIVPTVYWVDGVAPSFTSWGICELRFRKDSSTGIYLGEWKIYK